MSEYGRMIVDRSSSRIHESSTNLRNMPHLRRNDLIEPKLSYEIIGVLFDVFDQLGFGYQEYVYQRAVKIGLGKANLQFAE